MPFGCVCVAFAPALAAGWVLFDDPRMLEHNPGVNGGLSLDGLRWAFTNRDWSMWHPLTWVSHQLDFSVFGEKPAAFHLVSLLLHALTVVLAFVFLRSATQNTARSLFAALLFGLHPLRVESVLWLSERKDVLCTLFSVVTLLAHQRYRRAPGLGQWLLVAAATTAALLSKPTAMTLPFVLLLVDAWPLTPARAWRTRVLEKLPLLALAVAGGALTLLYQREGGAVSNAPLARRLPLALEALGLNLWHTVWPRDLSFLYPRAAPTTQWVVLSSLAWAALLASAWLLRHRARPWSVGVLWFLGVMLPTAGLVQVGAQLTADRYTYFAHLGLFAGLVFSLPKVPERFVRAAQLGCAAVLLSCAGASFNQSLVWQSSQRLFEQAVHRDPANTTAMHLLALAQLEANALDAAVRTFEQLLELTPLDAEVRGDYARALLQTNDFEAAMVQARLAGSSRPKDPYIGDTYARALTAAGRCAEAVPVLRTLLNHSPPDLYVEVDLGWCLVLLGRPDEAWPVLETGLARLPHDAQYAAGIAKIAQSAHRDDLARTWLDEAQRRGFR